MQDSQKKREKPNKKQGGTYKFRILIYIKIKNDFRINQLNRK